MSWPEELQQLRHTPRDAFGNKLERLRDLRMTHEVYISLLHGDNVQIMEPYEEGVQAAAARYQNLTELVLHSQRNQYLKVNVLLDVPEDSASQVLIKHSEPWWSVRGIVPQLLPDKNAPKATGPSPEVLRDLRDAIETALETIRRQPGYYEFAIRYGSLYLRNFNLNESTALGEAVSVSAFLKAIEGRVSCNIKSWYAPYDREILQRLIACEELLEPTAPGSGFFGVTPSSLSATLPSYRAYFIFKDPYAREQNVVVKINWEEDEDEVLGYKRHPVRFYKLKDSALAPKELMAANLLELKR